MNGQMCFEPFVSIFIHTQLFYVMDSCCVSSISIGVVTPSH